MNFEADEIKRRVPIREALKRCYGIEPDRRGFCLCMFHGEKTPSMKINDKRNDFYCFGCNVHGDVIDLYRNAYSLSYSDALRRIDADFGLNTFRPMSTLERTRQAARREKERLEKERRIEWRKVQIDKLTDFFKELRGMPLTAPVAHDLKHIEGLLDRFTKSEIEPFDGVPDDFDADARIAALKTKYEYERGDFNSESS